MRIAFDHHPVPDVGRTAGMARDATAGKSAAGQIHCPPEEMHRHDLSDEPGPEPGEDPGGLQWPAPEQLCGDRVGGRVLGILGERRRRIDLVGMRLDAGRQPHVVERSAGLGVERGHRLGFQRHGADRAGAAADHHPVVNEVELDIERIGAVRDG